MDITKHVAEIEEFMGRDFGEKPTIEPLTIENALRVYTQLFPDGSAEANIVSAEGDVDDSKSVYYYTPHIILFTENADSQTVAHELTHAYTRNHWPKIFGKQETEEKRLSRKLLIEGLAEYVSIKTNPSDKDYGEFLLKHAHKPYFNKFTWQHLASAIEEIRGLVFDDRDGTPRVCYALGSLVVASVLEEAKDKHAAFELLVKNVPPRISALTGLIEPDHYTVFIEKK
ncbi:hypothetical protein GOV10_02280 [Candidatus Woesearchaeota archaeon]|nr:hypothetical protein [Candidatus Woesearchaeota archaeon]